MAIVRSCADRLGGSSGVGARHNREAEAKRFPRRGAIDVADIV